ncbi:MAG: invasion associated locus B family protein [Afipia sp.]
MEGGSLMVVQRVVTIVAVTMLAVGFSGSAIAQTKSKAAPPKAPAKSAAKHAAAGSEEPTLVGQFGAWGAYVAAPSGKKVCFVLSKPTSSKTNPPNRPRDPAYAFISTRPAEKVVNEVSVMMGYPLKPGSDPTMEIGGAKFEMYAQGDGIWIKNAAEENRLVDALRKGADVTVKGESTRGTDTTDVFSLKGLTQALDKLGQECGK